MTREALVVAAALATLVAALLAWGWGSGERFGWGSGEPFGWGSGEPFVNLTDKYPYWGWAGTANEGLRCRNVDNTGCDTTWVDGKLTERVK